MSESEPRRSSASAAWRCATGCSCTGRRTGPPRCARAPATVEVASGRKPRLRAVDGIPGVRGVVRLAEAMVVIPLVKRALPEVRLPFQDPAVLGVAAGASVAGTALRRRAPGLAGEAVAGVVSLVPAVFALRGGELAQYHGVEHKAIAAYESGRRATRATPTRSTTAAARTSSRRCWSPTWPARCCCAARWRRPARSRAGAVALASTAMAVEVFAWCERNAETRLARALRRPGFEIQRLVGTREPDERPARGRPGRARGDPARGGRRVRTLTGRGLVLGSSTRLYARVTCRYTDVDDDGRSPSWYDWDSISLWLQTWAPIIFMALHRRSSSGGRCG